MPPVPTLSWSPCILTTLQLADDKLNRDSLSYRVILLSSGQKFGLNVTGAGQANNNRPAFASEECLMQETELTVTKELMYFLHAVVTKQSYVKCRKSNVASLEYLVSCLFDCSNVKSWMHCHDQEVCPLAGMSPEISLHHGTLCRRNPSATSCSLCLEQSIVIWIESFKILPEVA